MRMHLSASIAVAFSLLALPAGAADGTSAGVAAPPVANAVAPSADHAFALLGTWSCSTEQNNDASLTFKQAADNTIVMKGSVTSGSTLGMMITGDTYRYDPASQQWTLDSAAMPAFGSYHGTAAPWTQTQWLFYGNEPLPYNGAWRTVPLREVFTNLGSSVFRREFQVSSGPTWRDISEEVCTRAK